MLGFGVFMQYATCLICADEIATGELRQHLTGDYHTGCFTTIAAAGITVDRWTGEEAKCALCQQDIARKQSSSSPRISSCICAASSLHRVPPGSR